ncbi:PA2778 family cysteine peptidase, partial [Thioalkalicoccus limnaeus]
MLACLALAVTGCARTPLISEHLPDRDAPSNVELHEVAFFPQDDFQCGPAALATVLAWSGQAVTPEELVPRVYLPARQGSLQPEIRATARYYDRLAYELDPRLTALLTELAAGHPVLVLQNLGIWRWPVWHYAVVVGFDAERQQVILRSGTTERQVLSARRFLMSWARADAWA